jgi:hypothetical protein
MQVISDGVLLKKGAASQVNQNAVHRKVYFGIDDRRRPLQEKERHDTGQVGGVFAVLYYFGYCVLV